MPGLARCLALLATLAPCGAAAPSALASGLFPSAQPARTARIGVNCGGSGVDSLYCIPLQSVFAFTRVASPGRCALTVAFTVEPTVKGLRGRAHLTLRGMGAGNRRSARSARPRVTGGAYSQRFTRLSAGPYLLSGWYGGDGTRLASAHRSRRVSVSCAGARARAATTTGSGARHPRRPRRARARRALPLKMIWGPTVLPDGSSAFPDYHRLGVQVLQMQLSWSASAPERPANAGDPADPAYRWPSALDTAAREAVRYHIQLALMVKSTPAWANGGEDPSWAPNDPGDYAAFLQAVSRRYPSVRYWMIWGEPARPGNFNPMPGSSPTGPRRYAQLLDAAYGALKAVSPANTVIGGMSYTLGLVSTPDFVRWMRLPDGSPPRMDYYGHNPYSFRAPKLSEGVYAPGVRDINDIDTLHAELAVAYRGRPGGTPKLWLSEFSISSDERNRAFSFFVSRKVQAQWLTRAFRLVDSISYVAGLGWYELLDEPTSIPGRLTEGLLTANGAPKPAFGAYARAP